MPTINVLDAVGLPQAIELPNPNGRQGAANSRPVALSTEDFAALTGPRPVTQSGAWTFGLTGPLPSGSNPLGTVGVTGTVAVTGTFWPATQPVSAVSLPLPAGASTAALQTSGNASLTSIDAKTPPLVSGRVPVEAVTGIPAAITTTADVGSIEVGGTAQDVVGPDPDRQFFLFQNISDTDMRLRVGVDATATIGLTVAPGRTVIFEGAYRPLARVSVHCATTGKPYYFEVA